MAERVSIVGMSVVIFSVNIIASPEVGSEFPSLSGKPSESVAVPSSLE